MTLLLPHLVKICSMTTIFKMVARFSMKFYIGPQSRINTCIQKETISIFTRGGIKKVLQIFPDTNYRMVNWWCPKSFRPSGRFAEGAKAARGSNIRANKHLKKITYFRIFYVGQLFYPEVGKKDSWFDHHITFMTDKAVVHKRHTSRTFFVKHQTKVFDFSHPVRRL